MIRRDLPILVAVATLFLWQCSHREEAAQPTGASNPARSSSPTATSPTKPASDASSDCVGMGCDKPVQVPGVQGCVGMGCEKNPAPENKP
ncbi:MAG: hypothetical protein HY208_05550 [Nitrospirae bacterium]|nr:hypothetical protein [Nitrospirota bacterium]